MRGNYSRSCSRVLERSKSLTHVMERCCRLPIELPLHIFRRPRDIDGDIAPGPTGGSPAVRRWLEVLKAGGTRTPLELMQLAGIDMASPQPIRDAVDHVGRLVGELEQSFG